eukprot:jgi/Mesvir1/7803/Mv11745-RA.1
MLHPPPSRRPPPPRPSPPPPQQALSITVKSESGDQVYAGDNVDLRVTIDGKYIEDSGDVLVTVDIQKAGGGDGSKRRRQMLARAPRDSCAMFTLSRAEPTQGRCGDLDYDTCTVTCNLGTVVTGRTALVYIEVQSAVPGAQLLVGAAARPQQSQIVAYDESIQGSQGEDIDYVVFNDLAQPVVVPDYRQLVLVDADGLNRARKVWYGVKSPLRFYVRFRTDMDCTLTPDAVDTFGTADVQAVVWSDRGRVVGGAASDSSNHSGSLMPYYELSFEVAPRRDGLIWLQFKAGYCRDSQGRGNVESSISGMLYDGTPPVATVIPLHPHITSDPLLTFTVQWSERVYNFSDAGVEVINGDVLSFNASGEAWGYYEVYVTPSGDDFVFFIIHEGAAMDAASNRNAEVGGVQVQHYIPNEEVGTAAAIATTAIAAGVAAGVAGGVASSAGSAGAGGIGGLATMLGHIQLIQMMNGVDIPADPIVYESTNSMKWLSFVFPFPFFQKYNDQSKTESADATAPPASPPTTRRTSLRLRALLADVGANAPHNGSATDGNGTVALDCLATPLLCDLEHISAAAEEARESAKAEPDVTTYPELDDFQGIGDFLSVLFVSFLQVGGVFVLHVVAHRVWWALHRRYPDKYKDYPKFLMFPMLEIFAGLMVIPAFTRACAFLTTSGGRSTMPVGLLLLVAFPCSFYLYIIYVVCWKLLKNKLCIYEVSVGATKAEERFMEMNLAETKEIGGPAGEWKDPNATKYKDAVAQYGVLFAAFGGPAVYKAEGATDTNAADLARKKASWAGEGAKSQRRSKHSRSRRFTFHFSMTEKTHDGRGFMAQALGLTNGHNANDSWQTSPHYDDDLDDIDEERRAMLNEEMMGKLRACYALVVFTKQLLMSVLSGIKVKDGNRTLAGWCEMVTLSCFLLVDLLYVFFVQPQPLRRDWSVALGSAALEFGIVMCGLMLLVGDASRNKRYRKNVSYAMLGLMVIVILLQLCSQIIDLITGVRDWLSSRRAKELEKRNAREAAAQDVGTLQRILRALTAFRSALRSHHAHPSSVDDDGMFSPRSTGHGNDPETPSVYASHGQGKPGGHSVWETFRARYAPILPWSPRSKRTSVELLCSASTESPSESEVNYVGPDPAFPTRPTLAQDPSSPSKYCEHDGLIMPEGYLEGRPHSIKVHENDAYEHEGGEGTQGGGALVQVMVREAREEPCGDERIEPTQPVRKSNPWDGKPEMVQSGRGARRASLNSSTNPGGRDGKGGPQKGTYDQTFTGTGSWSDTRGAQDAVAAHDRRHSLPASNERPLVIPPREQFPNPSDAYTRVPRLSISQRLAKNAQASPRSPSSPSSRTRPSISGEKPGMLPADLALSLDALMARWESPRLGDTDRGTPPGSPSALSVHTSTSFREGRPQTSPKGVPEGPHMSVLKVPISQWGLDSPRGGADRSPKTGPAVPKPAVASPRPGRRSSVGSDGGLPSPPRGRRDSISGNDPSLAGRSAGTTARPDRVAERASLDAGNRRHTMPASNLPAYRDVGALDDTVAADTLTPAPPPASSPGAKQKRSLNVTLPDASTRRMSISGSPSAVAKGGAGRRGSVSSSTPQSTESAKTSTRPSSHVQGSSPEASPSPMPSPLTVKPSPSLSPGSSPRKKGVPSNFLATLGGNRRYSTSSAAPTGSSKSLSAAQLTRQTQRRQSDAAVSLIPSAGPAAKGKGEREVLSAGVKARAGVKDEKEATKPKPRQGW